MEQTAISNTTRSAELMTEEQVASATGNAIPRRRLQQLRQCGGGPPFLKIGRRVLYDWSDVQAWLDSQKRCSTSDMGAAV
jgi:hypothetical protein